MKFGIFGFCFMVLAMGIVRSALRLSGEHVCLFNEKYMDVIAVTEYVPMTVYKNEWCWSLPPRCTVAKEIEVMQTVNKEVPRVRVVLKCCQGYQEVERENKCVAVCSEPCLNGYCIEPEKCSCKSGYRGRRCEKPCEPGTWGKGCLQDCDCRNNATCDGVHGQCTCTPGWKGSRCDSPCEAGFYGINCAHRCDCGSVLCDHETGICDTTTEIVSTTTEITVYETTTETEDLTNSTEGTVTGPSTIVGAIQTENTTVQEPTNSTINLVRVYLEGENVDVTDKINETVEDNEVEHSQDLMGVENRQFSIFNILENLSILCGIFLLIFVVTMSSIMVSHYRKIRKTGYEYNAKNNSSNTQNFPLHRFYGGSILPSKTILDNQVCMTNIDLRVEKPILMTFKPLRDENSTADCITKSAELNKGILNNSRDSASGRQIVQFKYDEPKSTVYVCTRCKSV